MMYLSTYVDLLWFLLLVFCMFSTYRFCVYFVRVLSMYFWGLLFIVIKKNSDYSSLLIHMNTVDFYVSLLYSLTLINSFFRSERGFWYIFWDFSTQAIISSVNKDSFFPVCMTFTSFAGLTLWARISHTLFSRVVRCPCFVPDLGGRGWSAGQKSGAGRRCLIAALMGWWRSLLFPTCWKFLHERLLNFVTALSCVCWDCCTIFLRLVVRWITLICECWTSLVFLACDSSWFITYISSFVSFGSLCLSSNLSVSSELLSWRSLSDLWCFFMVFLMSVGPIAMLPSLFLILPLSFSWLVWLEVYQLPFWRTNFWFSWFSVFFLVFNFIDLHSSVFQGFFPPACFVYHCYFFLIP